MKIYLIRHGETTGDIEDRYGGDYDDHLSELGRKEAQDLAQRVKDFGIEKIFCSHRIRAKETAEILRRELGCDIEIVQNMRERNQYGILTGMVKSEAKQKYPDLPELLKDYRNTIEGAENYDDFSKRVHGALVKIAAMNYKIIAVVTHGGPIKAVLRKIKFEFDYKMKDCAFAEMEAEETKLTPVRLDGIEPKT
ncbi:MAG: histidine phosphatase family protein [bacterium]|nr:histidine phosphatase family protein [bacterium]